VGSDEVRRYFSRFGLDHGVEMVEGFFDETLPALGDRRWSIVRLDGDTYEATWLGLESLYPGLSVGGYLIVDDYGLIEECRQAVEDYRRKHGIDEPIERIDPSGVRWQRRTGGAHSGRRGSRPVRRPGSARALQGAARTALPTERELQLERELDELREGRYRGAAE
jgi:Macrocin-O-methyltransferase (TylF)